MWVVKMRLMNWKLKIACTLHKNAVYTLYFNNSKKEKRVVYYYRDNYATALLKLTKAGYKQISEKQFRKYFKEI